MYVDIMPEFMPMSAHGRASQMNDFSISTASRTIVCTTDWSSFFTSIEYSRTAKSLNRGERRRATGESANALSQRTPNKWRARRVTDQWSPSSREMNSLDWQRPGILPRFFSLKRYRAKTRRMRERVRTLRHCEAGSWLMPHVRVCVRADQKMEQNEPEKKIPSTAANATRRSANEVDELIH